MPNNTFKLIIINYLFVITVISTKVNAQNSSKDFDVFYGQQREYVERAQSPNTYQFMDMYKVNDKQFLHIKRHIGRTENGNKNSDLIELLDTNLQVISTTKLMHSVRGKNETRSCKPFQLHNQLYFKYDYYDHSTKSRTLFMRKFDPESMTLSDDSTYLGSETYESKAAAHQAAIRPGLNELFLTQNKNQNITILREPFIKKSKTVGLKYKCYDEKMSLLWENKSERINLVHGRVEKSLVADNGDLHQLVRILHHDKAGTFHFELISVLDKGNRTVIRRLKITNKIIWNIVMDINNRNELFFAGFYSSFDLQGIEGTFHFKINPKHQYVFDEQIDAFDLEYFTDYLVGKKKERVTSRFDAGKRINNTHYTIHKQHLRSDGGSYLVGMNLYSSFKDYAVNNMFSVKKRTHYGDIVVISRSANGTLEWMKRLPTKVHEVTPYSQLFSFSSNDKLFVCHYDYLDNFKLKDGQSPKPFEFNNDRSIYRCRVLSPKKFELKDHILFHVYHENPILLSASNFLIVSEKVFILNGANGRDNQQVKFTIK